MSKGKKVELQVSVSSQDQWEELLQKDGLIVVDAYAAWCGPCKAIVSTLKRIKNELGDDLLHFATAETDQIDSLSLYRGKSQPTFLFYSNGVLVYVIRGCNCPFMIKTITTQLEREHKILEGKAERSEYIDEVVGAKPKEDEKLTKEEGEEDEEIEVRKEVSLAIIKPDAVKAGLVEDIIEKVKSEGMEILRQEERTLTREEAAEFYKQHEGSEHFENLVEFMSSGPCMTLIISKEGAGEGIIPQFRDLIGPKDVNIAKEEAPNSIRAVYGTSSVMNAIHACDTSESAARELAFFFPDFVSPTVKTKKVAKESSHRTLALIRPDALRHHKDEILEKIKESGFSIAMAKEVTLTQEEAEDFYAEHRGKDFFEPLVRNMCSGPVMALCLAREDAVEGWRNLLGPKEVDVAKSEAPESFRAQFHVDESDMNPLHGSESHSAARREIEKIFPVETTVAVIKPETAEESAEQIVDRIKEAGFRIISRKDVGLTKELAGQFYHEHEGKDFFNGLTDYMSSGQSTVLLLEREDAVTGWRAMMGPTDPEEAREKAPDSIRAVFGKDICRNAVHGASNLDKAGQVIDELFPEVELLPNGKTIVSPQIPTSEGNALSENQERDQNNLQDGETQGTEEGAADGGVQGEKDGGERTEAGEQQLDGDGNMTKEDDGAQGEADGTPRSDGTTGDDAPTAGTTNTESVTKEKEDSTTDAIVDSAVADGAAETTPDVTGSSETANQDGDTKPDDGATTKNTKDSTAVQKTDESTTIDDNATTDSKVGEEATTDGTTPTQNEGSGDGQNTHDATTDEQPSSALKPGQDDPSKPDQDDPADLSKVDQDNPTKTDQDDPPKPDQDPPATTKDDPEAVQQT
ncbi:thioredoxin domain-containing protein 3 homolog isoform X2 [Dendronephthya gigantea]|uniref:thioredoxin domain-containing protein 3 homolog isoform X2 n=1 Tax=Dendronephthya gigantea TaxID=151771 RepID=UPI00106CECF2|nr:thioredoxin domain-containing protein 3 homolog isoform X2 [Dendronephthya gigantea]